MASRLSSAFRSNFVVPNHNILRWFPGHMHKGIDRMQARLKDIDCIIEVHDARIPFSGRDSKFRSFMQQRPHILLLNKCDLVEEKDIRGLQMIEKLQREGVHVVFLTDLRQYEKCDILKNKILPVVKELTDSGPRYNREGLKEYNIMVIGVPNVGKSTFINAVRWANAPKKGRAVSVGNKAGVTRSVSSKVKIENSPPIYIVDTPGILAPHVPNIENGMRLALCSCLPDHLVGEENIVDYLLFWMNKRGKFSYVDFFGVDEPIDNVVIFLVKVATKNNLFKRVLDLATHQYVVKPDILQAATIVLKAFRSGQLGKFILDDDV